MGALLNATYNEEYGAETTDQAAKRCRRRRARRKRGARRPQEAVGEPAGTGLTYSPRVDANDTVVLKVVSGEPEAEIVCGLLRSAGVECSYRDTEALDSLLEEFTPSGPQEIVVLKSELAAAQAVLTEAEQ